ncbi:hypothetical protein LSAT2_017054 [Lamellibrachia satsuma]|nr:hypothetical protein LSAT2_017054 [Lamellibrachia satsuma]
MGFNSTNWTVLPSKITSHIPRNSHPVVEFQAAIGTTAYSQDVVMFHKIRSDYQNPDCPVVQISRPCFPCRSAVTGSGRSVTVSSTGVYIDTTPPVIQMIFHFDFSWSPSSRKVVLHTEKNIAPSVNSFERRHSICTDFVHVDVTATNRAETNSSVTSDVRSDRPRDVAAR